MWTQRRKCITYFVTVALVTLLLCPGGVLWAKGALVVGGFPVLSGLWLSGLLVGHRSPFVIVPLCVLMTFSILVLFTLPTLGMVFFRGERLLICLVLQFVLLVVYVLGTMYFLSKPW
jgi:hypothetical protein